MDDDAILIETTLRRKPSSPAILPANAPLLTTLSPTCSNCSIALNWWESLPNEDIRARPFGKQRKAQYSRAMTKKRRVYQPRFFDGRIITSDEI